MRVFQKSNWSTFLFINFLILLYEYGINIQLFKKQLEILKINVCNIYFQFIFSEPFICQFSINNVLKFTRKYSNKIIIDNRNVHWH